MDSGVEKFIERVKKKFYHPNWANDYLKSGLPADLNLDGAITVDVFKKFFLVDRPTDRDLEQTIKSLFGDLKHNMLCIESGRGSGKSTFVQTLHLFDPDHEYEYPCIDFSKRKNDPHETEYRYCEDELFRLFRKSYRQMCRITEWFNDYKNDLKRILEEFPAFTQCTTYYINTLKEAEKCNTVEDLDNLFAGHSVRIQKIKEFDLKILLLLYLLVCVNDPSSNKRWILIFDSIEIYFESSTIKWVRTIDHVSDFLRAAFESINKEDQFYSRFTALFPIRTATSISFAAYHNHFIHQQNHIWGTKNEYIISLERFDFASQALLKKLKFLKDYGGYKTPLFSRCLTICSLFMPRQYIEAWLKHFERPHDPEFRLFTRSRLMPLFNYDFRKVMDHLHLIIPLGSTPSNTFLALEDIQTNAKKAGITQEYVANGENMITARLIFDALHNTTPNLFSEIGYHDFEEDHEPSIARAVFNYLYYSELKYYYNSAEQYNWGGEYPGVTVRALLNKLRPFSNTQMSQISSVLYKISIVMGNDRENSYVNNVWANLIIIKDLNSSLSLSHFQAIIRNYYFPDQGSEDDYEVKSNLLDCRVRLSDAGRCFTVWASKQYEFLLARSSQLCYTDPLFVYSLEDYSAMKKKLEKPFDIVRGIIEHVSIEKRVVGCLNGCSFCQKKTVESETGNCVFKNGKKRKSMLDCSLFQIYQECLMLIVDSIDYLDRYRIYVWQVASLNKNEQTATKINNWLLGEISKFNSLFSVLKGRVESIFREKSDSDLFFAELIRVSEECTEKLRVKDTDQDNKSVKVLQYHERLRLPRTSLWYSGSNELFEKAIKKLQTEPNSEVYDKITELLETKSDPASLIREDEVDLSSDENRSEISDEEMGIIKRKVDAGINQDLLLWAVVSPLYRKAVGDYDLEYEKLIKALGTYDDDRYRGSLDLMEAIWMNHPELGLPPDYKHLTDLEFDRAFHPRYRDHTTHMFKVFLLGLFLYEKNSRIKKAMASVDLNSDDFLKVWILTALFHDAGYMLENDQTTGDDSSAAIMYQRMTIALSLPLTNLFPKFFGEGTEKGILERLSIQPTRIERLYPLRNALNRFAGKGKSVRLTVRDDDNPIMTYFNSRQGRHEGRIYFDHGIVSAGMMLYLQQTLCDYYEKIPETELNSDQQEKLRTLRKSAPTYKKYAELAAFSVALHNIKKDLIGEPVIDLNTGGVRLGDFCIPLEDELEKGFGPEPIAWLLRLCDELQCWDRQYFSNPTEMPTPLHGDKLCFQGVDESLALKITASSFKASIIASLDGVLNPPATEVLPLI